MTAAMLRLAAGRDPLNKELPALIGELSTLSSQFRTDWAEQDVHEHRTGQKAYRHPAVGEIDVTFDVFDIPGEPGLSICTFSVEEGSPSTDRFALLSSGQPPKSSAADTRSRDRGGEGHRAYGERGGRSPNRRRTEPRPLDMVARSSRRAASA
jgi:hypothetical protein